VDGRNPAPVDGWFIPVSIGLQPSKVVQDFFHSLDGKNIAIIYQYIHIDIYI
jgi:hypothetical protein